MRGVTVVLNVFGLFSRGRKEMPPARPEREGFIRCPACHKEVHNTLPRCPYCSGFLEVTCPNCDRTTSRTLSTCPYCGTSLKNTR